MNKKQTIERINKKIDELILKGKTATEEFHRLCQLHKRIVNTK